MPSQAAAQLRDHLRWDPVYADWNLCRAHVGCAIAGRSPSSDGAGAMLLLQLVTQAADVRDLRWGRTSSIGSGSSSWTIASSCGEYGRVCSSAPTRCSSAATRLPINLRSRRGFRTQYWGLGFRGSIRVGLPPMCG